SILWLLAREHSARMALISRSIVAVVSSLLVVSPWIIRNYHVFGQFVFPRSDFGVELYLENHDGGSRAIVLYHPLWDGGERERYRQLGEIGYVRERGQLAKAFIRTHPLLFLKKSAQRAAFFWITAPEEARVLGKLAPRVRQTILGVITLLCFTGLFVAIRRS